MNKVNVNYSNGNFFFKETKDVVDRNQFINEILNRKYDDVISSSDEKNTKIQFILNNKEIVVSVPRDEMILINRLENAPVKDNKAKSGINKKAAIGAAVAALTAGSVAGYNTVVNTVGEQSKSAVEEKEMDETKERIVDSIFDQLRYIRTKLDEEYAFNKSKVGKLLNKNDEELKKLALEVYDALLESNTKDELMSDVKSTAIYTKMDYVLETIANKEVSLVNEDAEQEDYDLNSVNATVTVKSR
jgi:hypothetical protein